jgi:DNA-directed RNA polymerase beta subunit
MSNVNGYEKKFQVDLTSKKDITFTGAFTTYLRAFLNLENTIFRKNDIKSYYETTASLQYGENYLIKLYHTSNSKYNSVSFANNYSKTTGQPAKGRKVEGGQHLSWQSTAALLSHRHDNAVLKELYTFKSDSQEDKETFLMKIIKDGKYNMKQKYQSVTKKTINTALKIIGMEFT